MNDGTCINRSATSRMDRSRLAARARRVGRLAATFLHGGSMLGPRVTPMAWNMMQDVERRFDELRRELLGAPETTALLPAWGGAALGVRAPAADLADEGNEFVATIELPGVGKKDITLDVQPDGIRVRAQSETEKEKTGRTWVRRERSAVSYDRYIGLPDEVSPDQVTAKFDNGVLTIRAPKLEPSKRSTHRISIS